MHRMYILVSYVNSASGDTADTRVDIRKSLILLQIIVKLWSKLKLHCLLSISLLLCGIKDHPRTGHTYLVIPNVSSVWSLIIGYHYGLVPQ